jgi:hypothetical protein
VSQAQPSRCAPETQCRALSPYRWAGLPWCQREM